VKTQQEIWHGLIAGPQAGETLRAAMECVAQGLSDMAGQIIIHNVPKIRKIPISQVATQAGAPEAEIVGIYLQMESGLQGRVILILPLGFALNLVDLVMELSPGTSSSLGLMERSVLAEVGNLTLSYFLNAVSELSGQSEMLQPSPPAVIVDMLAAILNLFIASAAAVSDDLLIIETVFMDIARTVQFRMWMLPGTTSNQEHKQDGQK
jgi:chemotaxis protein CheC